MFSRSAQVFASAAIVELVIFVLAASQVDVSLLLLVVAGLSVLGATFLFRQTADVIRRSFDSLATTGSGQTRHLGDDGLRLVGWFLLAFPGLLTGLIGGVLLVPPVRRVLRPVIGERVARLLPPEVATSFAAFNRQVRQRDVVDVNATMKDPGGSTPNRTAPPELH